MNTLALVTSFAQIGRRFAREESGARPGRNTTDIPETSTALADTPRGPETHQSVLVREVLEMLAPQEGDLILDATAGAGGHSHALLSQAQVRLIALDADPAAVAAVAQRLLPFGDRARVIEANFRDAKEVLGTQGITTINKALFDLGWNRGQLYAGRGFSFMGNEPLLMSYGDKPASGFTAGDILNTWSAEALADVLFGYGEERYARRIAKAITETRAAHPLRTTGELVDIILRATPAGYHRGRTHAATKTFQALRIAVNDELGSLEKGIRGAWEMLAPGGRLAVISFHSIEDRAVKRLLKEFAEKDKGRAQLLTKKPITVSAQEAQVNPSARSAKLRGIERSSAE